MAEPVNNCFSTQLVYEDSRFNEDGVRRFVDEVNLAERYIDYAIVSIIGPQSSGKSTLLNHVFGTNFQVMNAQEGRYQTTKGIWLAQSPTLGPRYLVIDVEGTHGRERGGNTTFEKQSAVFALAISDVVIFNMWCRNVGLTHGTYQPILRILFQVMKKPFTQRKINLIFVLRDKTVNPLDKSKALLEKDVQKIWNDIADPQDSSNTALDDRFNVEVVGLSHYRYAEAEFKREVRDLKQLVEDTCTIGAVNLDWTPSSDFVDKALTIWDKIGENQDLDDLPTVNEIIATACCDKISGVIHDSFLRNETWRQMEEHVQSSTVQDFGNQINELIGNSLSIYDDETSYYDETVRNQRRIQLKETLLQIVKPAYLSMLEHIRCDSLHSFYEASEDELNYSAGFSNVARKCIRNFLTGLDNQLQDAFIQESNWSDATSLHEQLLQQVNDHVDNIRRRRVDDLVRQQRKMLTNELEGPIDSHLRAANEITWAEIRRELESKTRLATDELRNALSAFELDEEMRHNLVQELENDGRNFVRAKAITSAHPTLMAPHMSRRFIELFSFDTNTTRRVWEEYAQVEEAKKTAQSSVIKMLSVLAAVRIVDDNDTIEETLFSAIRDAHLDTLNSSNWKQVIQEDIILQPSTCKDLWNDFLTVTAPIINQALEEVRNKKWKKYATIGAFGSLAVVGGAVAVVNVPVIAAGASGAATAARAAFAAGGTARTVASGATTAATSVAAYIAWKKQQDAARETERQM